MQLAGGYSGSNVQRIDGLVRKQSSYLSRCSDYEVRREFLEALSAVFPYMPGLRLFDNGLMEMAYLEGQEGIEAIDLRQFGQIVHELHALTLPAPVIETGIDWLVDLASTNANQSGWEAGADLVRPFLSLPADAIVHGEITQVISDPQGNLHIIDWDECGWGSKYQDLGFVYYILKLADRAGADFDMFLDGYGRTGVDLALIPQVAGLIALAYAGFYDFEKRIKLGRELLSG